MPADDRFTEAEFLAAYARLVAEGDREGCRRLRAMMAAQCGGGGARAFADPLPSDPPLPPDVVKAARAAVDWPATQQLRQQAHPTLGGTKTAFRFRDVARRRRVLAAIARERELADALGAHHLPDSEPADVLLLHDALGNPVTDRAGVKHALFVREQAKKRLSDPSIGDGQRAFLERVLSAPAHAFEVKSLQTTSRHYVQMNPKALAAKKAWADRYGLSLHTVAFDLRRGRKHSGHRLYLAPDTVGPTVALASMRRVADAAGVRTALDGGQADGPGGGPERSDATGEPAA